MSAATVVWTVLPDPATRSDPGEAALTLLASPRLGGADGDRLSDYPAITAWPTLVIGVDIEFITAAGESLFAPATFIDGPPDAALWARILAPQMSVAPFEFPTGIAETPIKTYPAAVVADSLAERYSDMLFSENERRIRRSAASWEPVDRLIDGLGMSNDPPPAPLRLAADAWAALADFHREPDGPRRRLVASAWARNVSEPEFHTVVAALADHPALMTRLGLSRRVRVTLPAGVDGEVRIRARVSHDDAVRDYQPRTRCVIAGHSLRLATAAGSAAAPYLPLDDTSRFTVIDVDTDRAGLALRSYAAGLAQLPRDQRAPELRPPAFRSGGIFVAETDIVTAVRSALQRAEELHTDLGDGGDGVAKDIGAEDVLHGYRVDVFDQESSRWYPLCRRSVTYTVGGDAVASVVDEGCVSTALDHRGSDEQPENQLHQAVFRWTGWSMVAPPPGKMLDAEEELADPVPQVVNPMPYRSDVATAPGSLPALRYGRVYRLRARLVDIAGRSVEFSAAPDLTSASPAVRYRRYEPVPAPVVVSRRAVTAGESAGVLVVRTDNSDPVNPRRGTTCERHLLAPKAAVETLACHGVLDVAGEHRPDPDVYRLLADRDKAVVTGTVDPHAPAAPFVDADAMELPWLPDPMSTGFTMRGLPGAATYVTVPWGDGAAWHRRQPTRLIVEAAADGSVEPPRADGATLRVGLAPATTTVVQLSSSLAPDSEELLGGWTWAARDARAAGQLPALRSSAVAGTLPQLCPPRELTLVHAVRCPLTPPKFGSRLQAIRRPGDTSYLLGDLELEYDPQSTRSVHARAEWTDIVDDPAESAPREVRCRADLVPADALGDAPDVRSPARFEVRHNIGDTRYRQISVTPVGTSRYAAYFAQRERVRLSGQAVTVIAPSFVPGSVLVRAPDDPGMTYSLERDVTVDTVAGSIARRPGGTLSDGAEVEVEFIVPPVTREGPAVEILARATARPAPPVVHSVVPAFHWRREKVDSTLISTRSGNMFRVFLHRPWFDSGAGEQFAVVVLPPGRSSLDQARQYGSHFNDDPVFSGDGSTGALGPEHLPGASSNVPVLLPASDQNPGPDVEMVAVGYPVDFDPVRRLWFSDITVRRGPFVRLRVARLQPNAVGGQQLSAAVDTGFHLICRERKLSVTVTGNRAEIMVTGPANPGRVSEFTIAVQSGPAPGGDPALWTQLGDVPVTTMAGLGDVRTATVTLPAVPGAMPMRLLIREHEVLPGDLLKSTGTAALTNSDVRRLSYFDIVEL